MRTKTVKDGKFITRPSLVQTLRSLPMKTPRRFSVKQFKLTSVRSAATILKKDGYEFSISEKGMIDEYVITRLR